MFQQVDDDIYTIFNRWLRKRRDQIKDGKPVHGSALSFRNASHWPAATCHSGSARRRFWWWPRCVKLLEQAFYLFQSFFQLVAHLPDAARINLHLQSPR